MRKDKIISLNLFVFRPTCTIDRLHSASTRCVHVRPLDLRVLLTHYMPFLAAQQSARWPQAVFSRALSHRYWWCSGLRDSIEENAQSAVPRGVRVSRVVSVLYVVNSVCFHFDANKWPLLNNYRICSMTLSHRVTY